MLVNITKIKRKKLLLIRFTIIILTILLILVGLRYFHVIVKIGDRYHFAFSQKLGIVEEDVNHSDISEIVYMKRLKVLNIIDTQITNVDFLSKLPKLEYLEISNRPEYAIEDISSIANCKKLEIVFLGQVNVENLDVFSELTNLGWLVIISSTKIKDISGLKNLQKMNILKIHNIDCNDYSVLFNLHNLKCLKLDEHELTEEEIKRLEEKDIEVIE